MKTEHLLVAVVAVLVVFSIFQYYQISKLKQCNAITGNAVSGSIDMTGWTADEKMMYEHHGTLPSRLQGQGSAPVSSGMVGGC